jgi:hypothetical protein
MTANPKPNDDAPAPDASSSSQGRTDGEAPKSATLVPEDLPEDERIESENDLA